MASSTRPSGDQRTSVTASSSPVADRGARVDVAPVARSFTRMRPARPTKASCEPSGDEAASEESGSSWSLCTRPEPRSITWTVVVSVPAP